MQEALVDLLTILHQLPGYLILVQIGKAGFIVEGHLTVFDLCFIRCHPEILVLVFHFIQLWLWIAVRRYQAICTKIIVRRIVAPVAAKSIELSVHLSVVIKAIMGKIFYIVIVVASFGRFKWLRIVHPNEYVLAVWLDGGVRTALRHDFFLCQCPGIDAGERHLPSERMVGVLRIIANAEGIDPVPIGHLIASFFAADFFAVNIELHDLTIIGSCNLMPFLCPVFRKVPEDCRPRIIAVIFCA